MAMKRILTTSQREQLLSVDHLSEEDFKAYFSFSDYDLEVINQHRGKVNKLGFAIQLCLARYPGCSLSNWPIKSTRLTSYVSRQLHLDAIDLNSYDHRNTRANHFNEILEVFNYHRFGSANTQKQLIEYLIELALENDDSIYLMKKTIDFLTRKRIIFPSNINFFPSKKEIIEFKRVVFPEPDSPTIPKNSFSFISIFILFNIL